MKKMILKLPVLVSDIVSINWSRANPQTWYKTRQTMRLTPWLTCKPSSLSINIKDTR